MIAAWAARNRSAISGSHFRLRVSGRRSSRVSAKTFPRTLKTVVSGPNG